MNPVDLLGKVIEVSQSNLEINSRINSILNIISQELHYDDTLVFTFDRDKKLTCKYTTQKSVLFPLLSEYRCHIGEGVVGSVAQKRIPQYFTFRDIPPRFGCLFYPQLDGVIDRYRSFTFSPISDDSYIYGVLVSASSSKEVIQAQEKILLSMLSREIGGVLRVNDLMLSTKKRISELATLTELGKVLTSNQEADIIMGNLALIIARALNATFVAIKPGAAFGRLYKDRYIYGNAPAPLEEKISEMERAVFEKGSQTSASIPTTRQDEVIVHYALHSTPIFSKNTVLGIITIGIRPEEYSLSPSNGDYQYLAHTIASYISSGLENIILNAKLKNVIKELNNAQKRIIEQEKFKSLGEMTANIAHEIKNPLVIIGGFTKRLAKNIDAGTQEHRYMNIIVKEVGRLETILNEVLDYVKETPTPMDTCSINDCIEETLELLASDNSWDRIRLIRDLRASAASVECDIQQIRQVIINILMNAYDAMEGGGTITVTTENIVIDEARFLTISLEDTGGGIDPTIIDNIFNPFFTTKERGTGLGLAISNKIIMNHGGHIDIKNTVGKGVTFLIYLPTPNNKPERS